MNKDKENVILRLMEGDDILSIIEIHLTCFPTSRSSKLGKPFLKKMYTWYLLHQPNLAFVALIDNKVVGFVTGTLGWGGARRRFKFTFWQIIQGFLYHPELFFTSEMYESWSNFLKGLLPSQKEISTSINSNNIKATLDSIAVHPNWRNVKIGEKLIHSFEQSAEKQGATYLALGVENNNTSARRLYENCGWVINLEDDIHKINNYRKDLNR